MALYTKSIQEKKQKSDGIRICVMRRPDKNEDFDIWMPILAPSHKLLDDSHAKKIEWGEYVERFTKEVLIGQRTSMRGIFQNPIMCTTLNGTLPPFLNF